MYSSSRISTWTLLLPMALVLLIMTPACVQVKTEPIKIEPIYIEITVNHRVQKELDDVFADIDKASRTADYQPLNSNP
ncbi:MAG: hypothetical protein ACO3ZW_07925 [Opitutales bacterium]|jgi:hypothetical protein